MKITKQTLKKIIQEELRKVLREVFTDEGEKLAKSIFWAAIRKTEAAVEEHGQMNEEEANILRAALSQEFADRGMEPDFNLDPGGPPERPAWSEHDQGYSYFNQGEPATIRLYIQEERYRFFRDPSRGWRWEHD